CRSKRVCTRWRRVISDPDLRRLLPWYHLHDAVVGFFDYRSFISFSGRGSFVGPSLPFLPDCGDLQLLDICNGLLCRRQRLSDPQRFDYLVGVWSHKDNGWGCIIRTLDIWRSVFFKGMLRLITMDDVVAVVDGEGNTWRTIPMPETFVDPYYGVDDGFIDVSQDCLCFVNTDRDDLYKLSVWVLEDYSSDQWTLKHTCQPSTSIWNKQTTFWI
uniref:F-box domain-containing protein n=1 Tax=Oryza glaberrima TaxID=4538 RepID=I1PSV2_ORYGL